MEHNQDGEWVDSSIGTERFAEVREDPDWRISDPEKAFSEFRDSGPRGKGAFLEDVKDSIANGKFAPAWDDFKEALTGGSIFAIITARGHEPETLRSGVEWIIWNVLSDEDRMEMIASLKAFKDMFKGSDPSEEIHPKALVEDWLDSCYFFGVSAPSFQKIHKVTPSDPEEGKKAGLRLFIKNIQKWSKRVGIPAHIGMSDDDIGNVRAIKTLFSKEKNLVKDMEWSLYHTVKGKEKVTEKRFIKEFKDWTPKKEAKVDEAYDTGSGTTFMGADVSKPVKLWFPESWQAEEFLYKKAHGKTGKICKVHEDGTCDIKLDEAILDRMNQETIWEIKRLGLDKLKPTYYT
jgi:hypothetical protein